ncbi:hypothetical protein Cob_v001598 [Colletotrichum orbiculare MAFF 240422]|uniref:Uncharacterized protein n=1 Tax=Colletotrichum orbiculare (strain 104-T / ATCC 96160 / CBS 514.97 / LARS 414 / MAFF 240422) TaxID=1213857 RepID=N4UVV7_COLOR|nr:hypothetical protein Cob_v001598 [Colletotrichum orbiculare MAFF 240422]
MELTRSITALLAWYSLAVSSVVAQHGPSERAQLARNDKRALTSWVAVNKKGDFAYPCSRSQLGVVTTAVEEAKILAQAAIDSLDSQGASSPSFERWLGPLGQGDETLVDQIRSLHYGAVISNLKGPVSGTVDSVTTGGADDERLAYSCPSSSHHICNGGTWAEMLNVDQGYTKANVLFLCPKFFKEYSHSKMISEWKKGKYKRSAGLILLHEMQHLDAVVTRGRRCLDKAYDPDPCTRLSTSDKRINAQSYAFFALDVLSKQA